MTAAVPPAVAGLHVKANAAVVAKKLRKNTTRNLNTDITPFARNNAVPCSYKEMLSEDGGDYTVMEQSCI